MGRFGINGRCVLILGLPVVVIGCGLQAAPAADTEAASPPVQLGARPPDQPANLPPAPPTSNLDEDLPAPSVTLEITRRAAQEITNPDLGFVGWVSTSQDCYQQLGSSDLERRVYCLQMDAIAMAVERAMPAEWQAMDARANDYFTEQRFAERQCQFAPPIDLSLATEDSQNRKAATLQALAMVRNAVMEELVADRHYDERK